MEEEHRDSEHQSVLLKHTHLPKTNINFWIQHSLTILKKMNQPNKNKPSPKTNFIDTGDSKFYPISINTPNFSIWNTCIQLVSGIQISLKGLRMAGHVPFLGLGAGVFSVYNFTELYFDDMHIFLYEFIYQWSFGCFFFKSSQDHKTGNFSRGKYVYWFSMEEWQNYHKFSSLRQHTFTVSQLSELGVQHGLAGSFHKDLTRM